MNMVHIVACRPVARQRPRNKQLDNAVTRQRPINSKRGMLFSARSAPMSARETIDTSTEERCSLCGQRIGVISRTISES
jgi:hypothetical protein